MPKNETEVQLISNLVVVNPSGGVLFVRYDPDDARWWLPGKDLTPYEHPDEAARRILAAFRNLNVHRLHMVDIESFRGRRGWHVVFNYLIEAQGEPAGDHPTAWYTATELPQTAHGNWEKEVVRKVLASRTG